MSRKNYEENSTVNARFLMKNLNRKTRRCIEKTLEGTIHGSFITVGHHAKERLDERTVDESLLIKQLKRGHYRIIELNIKHGQPRCLVRTKAMDGYEIVASVALFTGLVITCWTNHEDDNHSTLDMNLYSEEFDFESLIRTQHCHSYAHVAATTD